MNKISRITFDVNPKPGSFGAMKCFVDGRPIGFFDPHRGMLHEDEAVLHTLTRQEPTEDMLALSLERRWAIMLDRVGYHGARHITIRMADHHYWGNHLGYARESYVTFVHDEGMD